MKKFRRAVLIGAVTAALVSLSVLPAGARSSSDQADGYRGRGHRERDPHRGRRGRRERVGAGLVQRRGRRREGGRRVPEQQGGRRRSRRPQGRGRLLRLEAQPQRGPQRAPSTACQNDLAMVGTAALFLTSVNDMVNCTDQAGQATGLPDLSSVTTGVPETCAPISFPAFGAAIDCATVTQNPQTFYGNAGSRQVGALAAQGRVSTARCSSRATRRTPTAAARSSPSRHRRPVSRPTRAPRSRSRVVTPRARTPTSSRR